MTARSDEVPFCPFFGNSRPGCCCCPPWAVRRWQIFLRMAQGAVSLHLAGSPWEGTTFHTCSQTEAPLQGETCVCTAEGRSASCCAQCFEGAELADPAGRLLEEAEGAQVPLHLQTPSVSCGLAGRRKHRMAERHGSLCMFWAHRCRTLQRKKSMSHMQTCVCFFIEALVTGILSTLATKN